MISADLANRFREVTLDGKWIANTNFKQELNGLDWKIAVKKPDSLNSISTLVQHIHYYIDGVKNVLKGGKLEISDRYSFDFPEVRSKAEWGSIVQLFISDAEEFAIIVEQFPHDRWAAPFVEVKYGTYQRNIEAMIEHCYYHLGQIVLIKKLLLVK